MTGVLAVSFLPRCEATEKVSLRLLALVPRDWDCCVETDGRREDAFALLVPVTSADAVVFLFELRLEDGDSE